MRIVYIIGKLGSNIYFCNNTEEHKRWGFDVIKAIPLICFRKTKLKRCDPDKNMECLKNNCYRNNGECKRTANKKYKMNIFKRIRERIKR